MGYHDTEQTISVERAEELRAQALHTPRDRYSWLRRQSWGDLMVDAAVAIWRDEEADRHDGERAGAPSLLPALPREVYRWYQEYADGPHGDGFLGTTFIAPIVAAESVITKTRTMKLTVDGKIIAGLRTGSGWDARGELRKIVQQQIPVTELGAIEIVSLPAPRKPVAAATEGKAKTVYVIKAEGNPFINQRSIHAVLNTQYDSQALARQAAIDLMTEHTSLPDLNVQAIVVREQEDGKLNRKLVTVTRPVPEEGTITVTVTTHTVKPKPTFSHYLVRFAVHR